MSKQVKILIVVALSFILLSSSAGALSERADVTVIDNGVTSNYVTYAKTAGEFFAETGIQIGPNDNCNYKIEDLISTMARNTIKITRGVTVIAVIKSEERKVEVPEGHKVGHIIAMLSAEYGIDLIYYGSLAESLQPNQRIELHVSETEYVNESEVILYDTETVMTERLLEGQSEVVREGVDGLRQITTKIDYLDGKEISREITADTMIINTVPRILHMGTAKPVDETSFQEPIIEDSYTENTDYENHGEFEQTELVVDEQLKAFIEQSLLEWGLLGSESQSQPEEENQEAEFDPGAPPEKYSRKLTMQATAYTADYQSTGKHPGHPYFGITASGMKAQYGVIAVDPNVIALGTRLYIYGYGYCIAGDTGRAIVGDRIDLYLNTSKECVNYGRRTVDVYVLE